MSKLVSVRKVKDGQLQAELSDRVEKPGAVNVLRMLNKGDSRFETGKERRAWFPVTLASLIDMGVTNEQVASIKLLGQGERFELNIENPTINGMVLKIQVTESVVPDSWQAQNVMKAAKQLQITESIASSKIQTEYNLGKYLNQNGYFLDKEGNFIFTKSTVTVDGNIKHEFVDGFLVPEAELANYGATLADKKKELEEVEQD